MGKIEEYRKYIKNIYEDYAKTKYANLHDVDNQLIMDNERNHYQLVSMGWDKSMFSYAVIFHLDIKPDGKMRLRELDMLPLPT